jgi:hypothetical protein
MKNCPCGKTIASNARVCPNCGNRFTHPFVKALAWLIGVTLGLSIVTAIVSDSENHRVKTSSTPAHVTAPVKPARDDAAFVIQNCGKPDREFMEKASGATIRHLVYRRFNTELFFFRGADRPQWGLGNAFVPNRDEDMTMEEANRRMPCAKGQLRSFLESK